MYGGESFHSDHTTGGDGGVAERVLTDWVLIEIKRVLIDDSLLDWGGRPIRD